MNLPIEPKEDMMKLNTQVNGSLYGLVSSLLLYDPSKIQLVHGLWNMTLNVFFFFLMQFTRVTEDENNSSSDTYLLPSPTETEVLLTHSVSMCLDTESTVYV